MELTELDEALQQLHLFPVVVQDFSI